MLLKPQFPESSLSSRDPYPAFTQFLPLIEIREGRYLVRFARTRDELDEILRLRFEIFNLELAEGLGSSYSTGRDEDQFDRTCHHLAVIDELCGQVVGTYRIQTGTMAAAGQGFYSAGEFNLCSLPAEVINNAIELGRACIAAEHRNTQVLYLLWKGLAAYLQHNQKRYLFGCCSLTSQAPEEGAALYRQLRQEGWLHPAIFIEPHENLACRSSEVDLAGVKPPAIPRLFRTYLRFGVKVCGPPAIDRQFKTIDYFVIFDVAQMNPFSRRMFFGG
jgi:putative hemolysin